MLHCSTAPGSASLHAQQGVAGKGRAPFAILSASTSFLPRFQPLVYIRLPAWLAQAVAGCHWGFPTLHRGRSGWHQRHPRCRQAAKLCIACERSARCLGCNPVLCLRANPAEPPVRHTGAAAGSASRQAQQGLPATVACCLYCPAIVAHVGSCFRPWLATINQHLAATCVRPAVHLVARMHPLLLPESMGCIGHLLFQRWAHNKVGTMQSEPPSKPKHFGHAFARLLLLFLPIVRARLAGSFPSLYSRIPALPPKLNTPQLLINTLCRHPAGLLPPPLQPLPGGGVHRRQCGTGGGAGICG